MVSMARKKKEEKEKKEDFDILVALEDVNEYLRQGFKEFIWDKDVKTEKEFKRLLKEYGG